MDLFRTGRTPRAISVFLIGQADCNPTARAPENPALV